MFLAREDVELLTGQKRPSAQIRWLSARGYQFEINAKGHPVVLRSAVESKLGVAERRRIEPRLEFIG